MSDVTMSGQTPVPEVEEHHAHHPFLQHHFEDLGQQHEASTLGMWTFLTTEILFFGGVLCAYWVYRVIYPEAWALGAAQQKTLAGGINTLVLIISSLTMALAVRAAQLGSRRGQVLFLVATLVFGSIFLGIKMYEYHAHWGEGLFPGAQWHPEHLDAELAPKVELFMAFYWSLTGLHALHMIIGVGLLLWFIWRAARAHFGPEYYAPVEIMGLYWHFVDIIWIFLFPFLYLIHGAHHHG